MVKRLMFGFVSGVAVGAFGYWYFDEGPGVRHLGLARDRVVHEAGRAAGSLKDKFSGFATNDIREELARTGTVVREKAQAAGHAIGDATANARVTAAIKTKLLPLGDDIAFVCGHGPTSTFGEERQSNPFIA